MSQNKTLVYNPSVKVEIISDGKVYDVSRDIVRGGINRVVNAASQVNFSLANKDLRYNNKFHRMDRIQVSLKRTRWIKVFTGYLDSVPVFQLYPGTVSIRASCTIKRLIHTWWDPALESSQHLMGQQQTDSDIATATGGAPSTSGNDDTYVPSTALTPDAGMGEMIRKVLATVGNWNVDDIHIQDVPTGFIDYFSENIEAYDGSQEAEAFKDLFGYNETIGTSGGGSGGGLENSTFTSIGPPANGSAYSMDELVAIVHGAGWRGQDVAIGASIIMAESTGDPSAVNPHNANGTIDRGLWQINSIHEGRKGADENWFDPAVSTRLARDIYSDSNSWQPWSTYSHWGTSGNHLAEANAAIARGIGPVPGQVGTGSEVPGNNRPNSMHNSVSKNDGKGQAAKDKPPVSEGDKSSANPTPPPVEGTTGHEYASVLAGEAPNTSQMSINDSIAAVALYKFPMMTYFSGERYSDTGYHSKLQAADISNGGDAGTPEMMQLAQWWYDNFFGKGILELIYAHGFSNNVGDDRNVGDGMTDYYNPSTMADHRNHVHIAMSGVVSADGTTSGVSAAAGLGGVTFENKLGKSLFDYIFKPTDLDQSAISNMFHGERAPVNDEPLIKVVRSISDASMRSFQSTPEGGIAFFYPDYFGIDAVDGKDPVLKLEDIELKEFHIDANDDAFTTHVFVRGNPSFTGAWAAGGEYGWLGTAGVATIENEWLFKRMLDVSVVAPEFTDVEQIFARYGVRPLTESGRTGVMTPQMEFLSAVKIFMEKWSEQYSTRVELTFMPELFPGMRIELVGHNVAVYVQSVSHSFDFSNNGGFSTSAMVTTPSAPVGSTTRIDGSQKSEIHEDWLRRVDVQQSQTSTGDGRNVR